MPRLLKAALAATGLLSAEAGLGGPPLPPGPSMIIGVGQDLLAATDDRRLWRRAVNGGGDWEPVASLPGEEAFRTTAMHCAADNSGLCLITLSNGQAQLVDLFQAGVGLVRRVAAAGEISGFVDKDTAYFIRDEGGEKRGFFRYRIADGSEARLGTLQPGEAVAYLHVDGVLTPFARPTLNQFREISDEAGAAAFQMGDFENLLATRDGGLIVEAWAHQPPVKEGARFLADVRFTREQVGNRRSVKTSGNWFFAFPTTGPLPVPGNGTADANNDVVLEMAGPDRSQLGVLCQTGNGTGVKYIGDLSAEGSTHIAGGWSAPGFILISSGPAYSARYQLLRLSDSPRGGWHSRSCATTNAALVDANVKVEEVSLLSVRRSEAISADGSSVPYLILAPKGVSPRQVLIDVYGAYGLRRDIPAYTPATQRLLVDTRTAIIFPIVRGDGDKGFTWAMASAPPHRQRAVDDVIAVAKHVIAQWPSLAAKPTIRGQSAGGWLAAKAALQRPDLFSGMIGYSGAYLLKGEPVAENNMQRFFDPVLDDLVAAVAGLKGNCRGLHFRFLHARDDEKVSFASAEAFMGQLRAQGCAAELLAFDHAGHQIALTPDRTADFQRLRAGYFTPF